MRVGSSRTLLMGVFACIVSAPALAAQGESHSVTGYAEFSVVRRAFGGEGLQRIQPSVGFDIAGVITEQPPLFLAVGVQYISHRTTDADDRLGLLQVYLEPRFQLLNTGRVLPYLFVRLGYMRAAQTVTLIDDSGGSVNGAAVQTGPSFGGGAGVLYRATPHFRGFASVGYDKVNFGDIDFDYSHVLASKAHGTSTLFRVGLSLDFSLTPSPFKTNPPR